MARQRCPFVVGVRFGLKKDGFAWECPQKVKKTSSDMLGFEKMCCENVYISDMVSRRVSFKISYFQFFKLYSQHGLS